MPNVYIISPTTLEPWDWTNPWTLGVGGSEIAHCEMVSRLGPNVHSYAPVPWDGVKTDPSDVPWTHYKHYTSNHFINDAEPKITINYRGHQLYELPKRPNEIRWFVAQDVDYPWTEHQLLSVDRYLCLCNQHVKYTLERYPFMADRIFLTSNGIRTDYINKHYPIDKPKFERVPYRMLFPSSPDRGLKFLLQNWFRIRERFPEAELRVAYGFNNLETIIKAYPNDPRRLFYKEILQLIDQPGVTVLGRLNVTQLYDEWSQASVYPYASDWPETGCITIMEAMALGAIPVATNFWAQGEHAIRCTEAMFKERYIVHDGIYVVDGLPQQSEVVRGVYLDSLFKALACPENQRSKQQSWAREFYDWNRIAAQWRGWIEEDTKKLCS